MPPTSAAVWNTDQMPGLERPSPDTGDLLREIDRGPIAIFWG